MASTKFEKTQSLVPFEKISIDDLFFWNNEYWTKADHYIALAFDNHNRSEGDKQFMKQYGLYKFNKSFQLDTLVNPTTKSVSH